MCEWHDWIKVRGVPTTRPSASDPCDSALSLVVSCHFLFRLDKLMSVEQVALSPSPLSLSLPPSLLLTDAYMWPSSANGAGASGRMEEEIEPTKKEKKQGLRSCYSARSVQRYFVLINK